ncbi:MAG: YwiC-like family protein [Nitrospinae bacterium]|nr:YwiC-like family protein [Nitrospinota bacterium]
MLDDVVNTLKRPVLPKEHGMWVALLAPLIAGVFAVRPEDGLKPLAAILLGLSVISGAFALEPIKLVVKSGAGVGKRRIYFWAAVYTFLALAFIAPLVFFYDRAGLVWFAIPAVVLGGIKMWAGLARSLRTLMVELLGVAGLALSAPAASYTQTGRLTGEPVMLFILMTVWFSDRVFTARGILDLMRSNGPTPPQEKRIETNRRQLYIHTASLSLAALTVVFSGGLAPWTSFLPFLLATIKFRRDVRNPTLPDGPMAVGYAEMRLSSLFTVMMAAAFWWKGSF